MTGANDAILNTYSYQPFGEPLASTGTTPNPFTYGGRFGVMEESDGRYFMRARSYDSSLGRFMQPDPIGMAGQVASDNRN